MFSRQVAHERSPSRHPPGRQRHGQRDRGQQSFRHVGDDDADHEDETDAGGHPDELADQEHDNSDRHRQDRNHTAERRDLLLERRRRVDSRLRKACDRAERSVHAGREHQRLRLARRHRRAREEHVPAPEEVVLSARLSISRHGPRFSRHGGVVHAHAEAFEQPAVPRHVVSCREEDHVTRDDVFGRNDADRSIALRLDLVRQQALERRHRFLGPVFLPE
jgi:hypothetical protein